MVIALASLAVLLLIGVSGESPAVVNLIAIAAFLAVGLGLVLVRRDRAKLQRQRIETAIAQERIAIARDLHDIVSHGLGLITLRASVATAVSGPHDCELRSALTDVEKASRATTLELRRMLVVLRRDADPPLLPTPGIDQIPELIRHAQAAGLTVDAQYTTVEANSEGVSVAVYRIVQEALTNVARHAGPTTVTVQLKRTGEQLHVCVRDNGRTHPVRNVSRGYGLRGLQERVTAVGGVLTWGPSDRGFSVSADIHDPPGDHK